MNKDYQKEIDDNFGVQNSQGVEINAPDVKRKDSNYVNKDHLETGVHQGNIYRTSFKKAHCVCCGMSCVKL